VVPRRYLCEDDPTVEGEHEDENATGREWYDEDMEVTGKD